MNETQFLEAYNNAGNIFNHWVFVLLVLGGLAVFMFALGLSLYFESLNKERSTLLAISILVVAFSSISFVFTVGHERSAIFERYTKTMDYQHVSVEDISYGNYVEFSYKDRDGNVFNEKVDSVYVTYVRDLKKGEKVRVDFKKIDIKTLKYDEAPNGLYDVKVHVDNDFKE